MTVIACVEDRMGLSFNGRRLSRDKIVSAQILKAAAGTLWCNPQSAELFESCPSICVVHSFANSQPGDSCFIESAEDLEQLSRVSRIVLFHWNRRYPYTQIFQMPSGNWAKLSSEDFVGNSHDRITKEIFKKDEKNE